MLEGIIKGMGIPFDASKISRGCANSHQNHTLNRAFVAINNKHRKIKHEKKSI